MRVDVVTIFPDYLLPLGLSLVGRARAGGLLDLRVHDLRAWTHDRHRTVDDSPYGGGAGMVMRPEPWGDALDALVPGGGPVPTFVVPTPAGRPFTQATAERLAEQPWLLLGCGRYEGIDQRVVDHAATRMPVEELSVGDYVLAGGEAAALVMVEAVTRVLPGVLGNPESLSEESHHTGTGGLLEAPGYTRPAQWRGLAVPEALVSGDHRRVAAWRHEQAVLRTRERRPDLLPAAEDVAAAPVAPATPADAAELLVLQRCCWVEEAQANDALGIPPLGESLGDVTRDLAPGSGWATWRVRVGPRLVGSVRARAVGDAWEIGRLMVAPDARGRGLGRRLLEHAEAAAPDTVRAYELFTGAGSTANLRRYRLAGYRPLDGAVPETGVVRLRRERSRRGDDTG